jgi:tetratricopeptide (TPR) repeat protein
MEKTAKTTITPAPKVQTGAPAESAYVTRSVGSMLRNRWVVLILGILLIVLVVVAFLLVLYTHLTWYQIVIPIFCVAYFPLTYLAYQLRSERHKERLVDDFRLLGLVKAGEEKAVEESYQKIHSPQQYIIYVSLASLVTLLGFGLFYFNPNLLTGMMDIDSRMVALTMFYSFLGAFVFSIFNVYRRYVTFDLQPGVYLYVVVMMLTVIIVAFILADFLNTIEAAYLIPVVAFLIGYLPDAGIRLIYSLASRVIGRISRNETGLSKINGISLWHETRLRESGIDNTQNLQACDVRELLLSSRFSAQQLMNWIDQAILVNNVNSDVLEKLNDYSICSITSFISIVENKDFSTLPDLPYELVSKGLKSVPDVQPVGGEENPPEQPGAVALSQDGHPADEVYRKNLLALYQAIYYATDSCPNYHYVNRYWKAVKRFRTQQIDTALERSLQDLGIKIVGSLLIDPDMIEDVALAWKGTDLPPEVLPNLFPMTADGKVALGNLYVELDCMPDAMDAFKDAIAVDSNFAPIFASRGMAYSILRKYSEAYADFHQAKEIAPNYAVTYHHEGVTLMKQGHLDQAIEALNNAIEKDKTYAYAYFNRGRAYSLLNDYDRAQADFTKSIQLKNMARAYFERGVIFTIKGMIREAIDDFSNAIMMRRDDANAYAWRGFAYLIYGDLNRALYNLDTAVEFDPKLALAYDYRGQLYFQMEYVDNALDDYNKALELEPKQVRVYKNRAIAYIKQGNLQAAVSDLRQYLKMSPNAADFQAVSQQIAKLEEQLAADGSQ